MFYLFPIKTKLASTAEPELGTAQPRLFHVPFFVIKYCTFCFALCLCITFGKLYDILTILFSIANFSVIVNWLLIGSKYSDISKHLYFISSTFFSTHTDQLLKCNISLFNRSVYFCSGIVLNSSGDSIMFISFRSFLQLEAQSPLAGFLNCNFSIFIWLLSPLSSKIIFKHNNLILLSQILQDAGQQYKIYIWTEIYWANCHISNEILEIWNQRHQIQR